MATKRRKRKPGRTQVWVGWSDEKLLDLRFKDLDLSLSGTLVESCVEDLGAELEARGVRFRPHVWLSAEWMSPLGVPGIAIPFYLAHPRLARLERRQLLEVEGGTRKECMKILRHECGHAVQQAYRLQRRRRWQQLFGSSTKPYPDAYRPNPASKRFVQHLRMYYAQSHPDEDFAETFAVWMGPRTRWRKRYAGWPALDKLEFVDETMAEIGAQPAAVRSREHVEPLGSNTKTLRKHYAERRGRFQPSAVSSYDRHLRALFTPEADAPDAERATRFLTRNRGEIRRLVSRWTGEYQFTLDMVLAEMIVRCRELGLRAVGDEEQMRMDFAVVLTVNTMHSLYSKSSWVAL
ncbi:MAG: putative zinc-binding metallopeptidase [Planctomycetes bacterium]|nr:putative zinc-binding metallopeptidase [Planctomycetota bacterium]